MSTEIAKRQATTAMMASPGPGTTIDATDILIPKLLIAQALSEVVSQGKVTQGCIYRSTTGEVMAAREKSLEIIPLLAWKTWRISELQNGKYEYVRREPMIDTTAPLQWEEGGVAFRRDREMNFYVLLPQDIDREIKALAELDKSGALPSPDDALLPCVVTFARTGYGAGKVLATHFAKAGHFRLPAHCAVLSLKLEQQKNELGTFYVWTVDPKTVRRTTDVEIAAADKWCGTLRQSAVRVDDAEDEPATAAATAPADDGFAAEVARTF